VAAMDKRMIKPENDRCPLNAIRLAMVKARFKSFFLVIQNYIAHANTAKAFIFISESMKSTIPVIFFLLIGTGTITAQLPDHIYMPDIKSVKLFRQNNQQSAALITLNAVEQLELHFDDLSGMPKNYYYTFQLCNADWSPADLSEFDYIKGFIQNRLSQYNISSIATTKYVHYRALLPEQNCVPSKSGNYLLKVFLDADVTKLAFTKRFLVVDNKVSISAKVLQPFDPALLPSHQKIQFSVNTLQLNVLNQQQVKAVVLQNGRWDNAVTDIEPAFIRGTVMEYNGEQDCLFAAGKEYRWADLQSFRFHSERIDRIDNTNTPIDIFIKPDPERTHIRYAFYQDTNGWDQIGSTAEYTNPWWQSDYANVHFSFVPDNKQPFAGKSVYLLGELTGNEASDSAKMTYDALLGVYTKTLLLKQGYYSYVYVTKDDKNKNAKPDPGLTEGNYWETENAYTILFYYRSFSGRYDELIGLSTINSRNLTTNY
jgi:hypothetical protein